MRAALIAVSCVAAAATLGQLLAGDDPRSRLAELDTARLTLPFAARIVAGIVLLPYVVWVVVDDVPWIIAVWRDSDS